MANAVVDNPRGPVQKLNIDDIVSSHPELGPTPPDGGYGWVVLFSAIVTQITIPSILNGYGIIILYLNIQQNYDIGETHGLWDNKLTLVPILATVCWLMLEPWCRAITILTNKPKLVSMSGILLTVAGVLLSNFSAELDESEDAINVFSGLLIGTGASLTTQQANIILKHYFRKKLLIVQVVYKTSITLGYILITVIMGLLCITFEPRRSLIIYSVMILQNCVTLFAFRRPIYIVKALKKNYKMLQDASEDEDEDIYPTQAIAEHSNTNAAVTDDNRTEQATIASIHTVVIEDDQDEHVIGTFNSENTTREVIQTTSTRNNFTPRFSTDFSNDLDFIEQVREHPEALYRETTVSNDAAVHDNAFIFDAPSAGSVRRTANTRKNVRILTSILKDFRFYSYTFILLTLKFSMMMFAVVYPSYLSQRLPDTEMWKITVSVLMTYIASMCLNSATAALAFVQNKKWILRILSLIAFASHFSLALSESKSWLMIWGILATFSTTAIFIIQEPIYNDMLMDFDSSVISIASNSICALFIMFFTLLHNYNYDTIFKMAGCLYLLIPFLCFYL